MSFCPSCGQQLPDNAKFCFKCGSPLSNTDPDEKNTRVGEGDIRICPNCGQSTNSFSSKCPYCGTEFRNTKVSSAVQEFANRLQEIDNKQLQKAKPFWNPQKEVQATIEAKINLIQSFAIPNNKEDICEFLIMALSNIDPSLEGDAKRLSDAWLAKAEQSYQKATLTLGSDPDFNNVKSLYEEKMKYFKKKTIKKNALNVLGVVLGIGMFVAMFIWIFTRPGTSTSALTREAEKSLNSIVAEIQEDIANEDYDAALVKANGLRFDAELSESKAKMWDEQRNSLIELINEKKNGINTTEKSSE